MVLVAFTLPEVRVPEIKPLPWTEKSKEGEVVPTPREPVKNEAVEDVACSHPTVGEVVADRVRV